MAAATVLRRTVGALVLIVCAVFTFAWFSMLLPLLPWYAFPVALLVWLLFLRRPAGGTRIGGQRQDGPADVG